MNIQVYTIKPIKLEKLKDACGQEIIPIKNRLKLHINQNTVGTDSGWIDGCDRRICWSDKDFDYVKAYEFCISYNRRKNFLFYHIKHSQSFNMDYFTIIFEKNFLS